MAALKPGVRAGVAIFFVVLVAGCAAGSTTTSGSPAAAAQIEYALPFTDFAQTGFVHLPGGHFAADPAARLEPDPARPDAFSRTVMQPALYGPTGSGAESYD